MAKSDVWRFNRYEDKARDLAHITAGISSYLGSAANDRSYRVTWGSIAGTYGGTDITHKRVILAPVLLDKVEARTGNSEAPYSGEAVDIMQGVAAHEAGHITLTKVTEQKPEDDGIVGNIVEDMMIDGPAYRAHNPGLGKLTHDLREYMSDDPDDGVPGLDKFWRHGPTPCSAENLLRVWAVGRLYGHRLARVTRRDFEAPYVEMLDRVADRLYTLDSFTDYVAVAARNDSVRDINAILARYAEDEKTQPREPGEDGEERDEDEGDGDGEGSGSGKSGKGKGKGKTSKGSGSGPSSDATDRLNSEDEDGGDEDGDGDDEGDDGDEADADADADDSASGTDPGDENGLSNDAPDARNGSESGDSRGEAGDADSDAPGGKKGGKASSRKAPADWDKLGKPEVCMNHDHRGGAAFPHDIDDDDNFWKDVQHELAVLDIAKPGVTGKVHLAAYTDKRTVAGVRRAYQRLASEPVRQAHHDSGRVNKRALGSAMTRDDVFTRLRDKKLDGNVVLILDLSGSVQGHVATVKACAASVYEALGATDLRCHVYSYGKPNVAKLADPRKVYPAFANIDAGGGTPTSGAFVAVLKEVRARGASNVIIHITDGVADNVPAACAVMEQARKTGWKVINVGVGGSGSRLPYRSVSDSVQYVQDYTELPKLMTAAIGDIVQSHKRRQTV